MRHLLILIGLPLLTISAVVAAEVPAVPFLGVAWYPEQWPEQVWDHDLALMQEAGIRMARIGEFAWSTIEPTEGRFELDWMERAIAMAAEHDIVIVIGTPTDAPPAWLTTKYPDTLRVDDTGRRAQHGNRRQFSYTSPKYRELCRTVVENLARRFGNNPNVIGWQIDNEYTEDSYDDYSRQLFHQWLEAKYGSLEALNRHWVTAYWSQTYDHLSQVPIPVGRNNPGLRIDYMRFVTDQWRAFQRNQLEVIRRYADSRQFITTNLGGLGWADRFNRTDIAADLDFISWDNYVGQGHLEPYRNGATHDLVRGWKQKNFWVLEVQPGFVDWAGISNSLDKGESRVQLWQAVGHGADAIAFWEWRNALNGQEQYHGSLVGPGGEPLPYYEEARQVGAEFAEASPVLAGTSPVSEVALVHDYDSRWAIEFNPHSRLYDVVDVLVSYYRPLRDVAQSVDVIDPRSELTPYKLVVAPSLNVISDALAKRLVEYVEQGGHLVLGPRSGMKDEFNALRPERQPGPLAEPLGGRVEQFYALLDDAPISGEFGSGQATIWAEMLSAKASDTQVLMRYGASNGWLDGQPAVLTRPLGKGTITLIGALLDPQLTKTAAEWMLELAGIRPAFGPVPAGVEVCPRVDGERRVYVLLNHTKEPKDVALPAPMVDVLGSGAPVSELRLGPRGVAVAASR